MARIAAAVEAGQDCDRSFSFKDEHQSVWKTAKNGPADALVYDRKLIGIGGDPLHEAITASRKCRPKPVDSCSYHACAPINSLRAAGVKMTGVTKGNAAQVRLSETPM
jgi:hypothetical protein